MGKMKQIYEMVQDGTADIFIDIYKQARINDELGFTYDYKYYDITTARAMVSLINKAEKDYNKHIDHQAEIHSEWKAEIARGK